MKLTVVIPFCQVDSLMAWKLLDWISELGSLKNNDCLLVTSRDVQDPIGMTDKAKEVFKSVTTIRTPFALKDESHPRGPNWMFETTLKHMSGAKAVKPWLWLEPDSVPMRTGWLEEIEHEYIKAQSLGFPILAHVVELDNPKYPARIPSGVAVYPPNALGFYKDIQLNRDKAWDVAFADRVAGKVYHTNKIWSRLNRNRPPIFSLHLREWMAKNVIGYERVKSAALVHPSKDGSLIKILRDLPKPIEHVRNGEPLFRRSEKPSLAVLAYLPPDTIKSSVAFQENLLRFKTANVVHLYSDSECPVAHKVPNPEMCEGQANKLAVNNCVFLFGLKLAIEQKVDFMLYLEADCRVNGDEWDKVLFDEFLSHPKALVGGSPVIRNIDEASDIEKEKSNRLATKFTEDTKIPFAYQIGDNLGFMLHPNGAIGIYSTRLLADIFQGYQDPMANACKFTAWDLEIGRYLSRKRYDAFEMFQPLTRSYSGWKNQVLSSVERKKLMTKRGFVAIHQVKDEWTPP